MRQDAARRAEQRVAGGVYGEGALDEVTVPQTDVERMRQELDPDDPADVPVDPTVLRDGGPTRGQGAVTTTGGTAGRTTWQAREDCGPVSHERPPAAGAETMDDGSLGTARLALSLVASYLPARRATRLDPVAALRPQ